MAVPAVASAAEETTAVAADPADPVGAASKSIVTLNVRDFGAIGDGRLHRVTEWIAAGKFSSLRALHKKYPFVDSTDWTLDELAFTAAKLALPAAGGTLHFPAGHYVSGRDAWKIHRDHVRLTGEGAERTILSTAPNIAEGLVLAPYRHVGWMTGAKREYSFFADSGARGAAGVRLKDVAWTSDFQPGELVFIRNGGNRFDQDYGEFNEVADTTADGQLLFKHPLARDYTLARMNWAGEVAEEFKIPGKERAVRIKVRRGEGFFEPGEKTTISIGDFIFRVEKAGPAEGSYRIVDYGRGNPPRGTVVPAGTKISKSRSVIKLTRTVRDFRCENLQIVGRRKALNLSNSYDSAFTGCTFVRDLRDGGFKGGLTIDGDGGRFARFESCRIVALPAAGMQFARSFGGIEFVGCTFTNANAAFTEFNFDVEVRNCTFAVTGTKSLTNVIIAGKSCGDLRFLDNRIVAHGVAVVFDAHADIQSHRHAGEGEVVVRGNTIETDRATRVFLFPSSRPVTLTDNEVTRHPATVPALARTSVE